MKVFADKLGYEQRKFMNLKKLFPWKPVDVQLGTISENARIGDCYKCAKFYACIKKCTICLKFRVMPPDYFKFMVSLQSIIWVFLLHNFSRVINLLLTKLARDRTGRISALGLFCTVKTSGRYSPSTALVLG